MWNCGSFFWSACVNYIPQLINKNPVYNCNSCTSCNSWGPCMARIQRGCNTWNYHLDRTKINRNLKTHYYLSESTKSINKSNGFNNFSGMIWLESMAQNCCIGCMFFQVPQKGGFTTKPNFWK